MFDIIIPTYNNLVELKHCLLALEKQTLKDFKVYVGVDGSTDGTGEFLENSKYSFPITVLYHEGKINRGRNLTRNLIISHLSSEYLLMLDSDVVSKPDLLQQHCDLLNSDDCISLGELFYSNANQNIWADYLHTRGKSKYDDKAELPPHYLVSSNVAFKSKYFNELNGMGLEECTGYGGEDAVLGFRLNKQFGLKLIYNKQAAGFSSLDKTLDQALLQLKEFGKTNLRYIREKYPEMKDYFKIGKIDESRFYKFALNFLSLPPFEITAQALVKTVPRFLRLKLINYLVMVNILKGYKS